MHGGLERIRRGMKADVQGATRSRTRRARRPDLLSYRIYLRRLCFPRKNRLRLDQARASRKKIARRLFASAKIASRGFSSYLDDSSKESARLINGSNGASIRAYLSREIQFIMHIVQQERESKTML